MANLYGRTIRTSDPLARATEDDAEILVQWCLHTLRTRRGTLRTAPDHGLDLPGQLLTPLTAAQRLALPAAAKAALERGKKVATARVTLRETNLGGGKLGIALDCEVVPAKGGPAVSFTHAVDDTLADYMIKGT